MPQGRGGHDQAKREEPAPRSEGKKPLPVDREGNPLWRRIATSARNVGPTEVGKPDDPEEAEAERFADTVRADTALRMEAHAESGEPTRTSDGAGAPGGDLGGAHPSPMRAPAPAQPSPSAGPPTIRASTTPAAAQGSPTTRRAPPAAPSGEAEELPTAAALPPSDARGLAPPAAPLPPPPPADGGDPPRKPRLQHGILAGEGGERLPDGVRQLFEPRLGIDLDGVRIHTGGVAHTAAGALGARAFASGGDIAFAEGEYRPDTPEGRHLLAHELMHVAQSAGGARRTIRRKLDPTGTPAPGTLLVEDGQSPEGGQLPVGEFLEVVRAELCRELDAILVPAGRSTEGCPYLTVLFPYLEGESATAIETILRRFAPDLEATSALDYLPRIVARATASTRHWLETGEITGLPEGLPTSLSALASLAGEGGLLNRIALFFKAKPGGPRSGADPRVVQARLGPGRPLEGRVRSSMESAFRTPFSS